MIDFPLSSHHKRLQTIYVFDCPTTVLSFFFYLEKPLYEKKERPINVSHVILLVHGCVYIEGMLYDWLSQDHWLLCKTLVSLQ